MESFEEIAAHFVAAMKKGSDEDAQHAVERALVLLGAKTDEFFANITHIAENTVL